MSLTTRTRRVASVASLLALAICAAGAAPQVIATNGAPSGPRTGLIVGQVVDSTGAPVPEAVVQLTMPKYSAELPTTPKGRVMADGEGRYFFTGLPAGEYYIRASKEGYTGGTYGMHSAAGQYRLYTLGEGDRRADARLTLWKYGVIGGTVLDEAGEPAVGVTVQALLKDVVAGRVRYGPGEFAYLIPVTTTDDRGMFRLSALTPGSYVVVVPSAQATLPVAVLNNFSKDSGLLNEVFSAVAPNGSNNTTAVREALPIGQPGTIQSGDVAMVTMSGVLIPPATTPDAAADKPAMAVYRTTYFPAATTASAASVISLGDGEERTDLAITLRPSSAVRVSGRLIAPDGSPAPPMALRLVGEAAANVADAGFEVAATVSDAAGRFALLGVPPGDYVLKSSTRISPFAVQQGRPVWWASQRVSIGATGVSDLSVALHPPLRVEVRAEFPATTDLTVPPRLRDAFVVFETPFGDSGQFASQGPTLPTVAAGGQYIARPIEASGWFMKSVSVDGKDVTDKVFDLQADAKVVVVYTDQKSTVTGTVKDARGNASATAVVLAFPVDPLRWSGFGSNPRTIKSTPASSAGAYTFANLPAGEYYVVAVDATDADGWMDPRTLEGLARQATKLTVIENESKTIDLTLRAIR